MRRLIPSVLVTGAGAVLGQGILRSLIMSKRSCHIITADSDPRSAGHWLGDVAHRIEPAKSPDFLSALERIIEQESVDVLFVGTDAELPIVSRHRHRLERTYGLKVIVSEEDVIAVADDKWRTAEFLRERNLPFPHSARSNHPDEVERLIADVGFPLFAKPRIGARSIGARIINDRQTLDVIYRENLDYVIQELLSDADGEFTAGCIVLEGRCRAVVNMRRDLRDGNTYRAYADVSGRFEERLRQIAEALGSDGPVNIQFRVRNGEPVVFEFNARFSGTTPIRAIFGFNEVEALLDYYLDGKPVTQPTIGASIVLRVWSDILISPEQLQQLERCGVLTSPQCQPIPFAPRSFQTPSEQLAGGLSPAS